MSKKTILLVDDSSVARMTEQLVLKRSGAYEVRVGVNGREAVAMARSEPPDLILMDVVMPEMDGLQACQELRRLKETRAIPIILITTRGEAGNVQAGFECGCNDYVTKPVDPRELLRKIENLIGT